ncbi:MAG: hypothetical protein KAR06_09040 [Deltaproteobacteria bacterium]|nr:hypothetical protein [Deltaproteobacteria bacterium]
MKKLINGEKGEVRRRALLWILLLFMFGYACYVVAPPYIGYHLLRSDVKAEVENAHFYTDHELTTRILEKADSWGVPIVYDDVRISRWSNEIELLIEYSEDISFFNRYERTLYFDIYEKKELKSARRKL